jgi:hypothetical protein
MVLATMMQPKTDLPTLVERAIAAYPTEEGRIRRGAEIVTRDGVRQTERAEVLRIGIYHFYPVQADRRCPCPDVTNNRPSGNRCKHVWAACLWRHMHQGESVMNPGAPHRFVASLGDGAAQQHGIATEQASGTWLFQPYDTDEHIDCALHEIVLGGRLDLMHKETI